MRSAAPLNTSMQLREFIVTKAAHVCLTVALVLSGATIEMCPRSCLRMHHSPWDQVYSAA